MGESGALLGVLGTVELPTVTMLYLELQNQEKHAKTALSELQNRPMGKP